mmetsp:Transcript_20156/g.43481  ORF Transcript_20156/g.43481 Transcript_20156/m.43481 type:complete len:579 (-) Transcript_20156:22-1758(-)
MARVLNVKKAIRRRNRLLLQEQYYHQQRRLYFDKDDDDDDGDDEEDEDEEDDEENERESFAYPHPLRIIGLMLIIYNTAILYQSVRFEFSLQDEIESLVPLLPQFGSAGRSLRSLQSTLNQEDTESQGNNMDAAEKEAGPGLDNSDQLADVKNESEGQEDEPEEEAVLEWNHPATSPPWTVFLHIYLPPRDQGDDHHDNGLNIVREQIEQVAQSFAGRSSSQPVGQSGGDFSANAATSTNTTIAATTVVYYTSIGGRMQRDWMRQLCQEHGLDCQNLGHHMEGHEMITLDKVQDFCAHHPQQIVSYVHTKGSFHADMEGNGEEGAIHQSLWRYHMTAAATSQECLLALSSPFPKIPASSIANSTDGNQTESFPKASSASSCNACGLLFSPLPLEHFTGNSWAAQCKYIQQLLPSSELQVKRAILMENLKQDGLQAKFLPAVPNNVGSGRYLGEQWIGSSPQLVPCDVSREVGIAYWMGEKRNTTIEFDLHLAPRFPMNHSDWAWNAAIEDGEVLEKPYRRMRDFFLLPGHLHRWAQEYKAFPPITSWVWDWFVDGHRWRKRVDQHGVSAVQTFIHSQA